ncbi:hypothetical protein PR202_ga23771 [Eleusine coracana subsp. coracana]|uniref:PWWP domain-containing protein n=1 Tax=Eleusine coracana subsp. coracana TaxID=191504 RepID=A0AAV5D7F4_ELECO|nr:hypothetical protein PR202_ga23771 [Eleusine coracana subsp. coracana]
MEAKTLNPDADADGAPGTLAAGELVWAKPKGRRTRWWPARLLAACPAAARDAGVAYFGDPGAPPGPAVQVRRFADPDADGLARGSAARAFLAAVDEAHAGAVAALRAFLTCGCVPPPPPPPETSVVIIGVANLSPAEFLAALRDAALAGSPVGLVDRARLKSWVRALGEGWGPGGAGHYPRRTLVELEDKIDLDVPAGEDKEDDEPEASEPPQETPAPQKKRRAASRVDEVDAEENEGNNDSTTGTGTSGKRERKRSKYLSPPYTNVGVVTLPRKATDSPKALAVSSAESDSEVLSGSIGVEKVLSLVLGLAKDCATKRSRKNDDDGRASSSIKRKKREKYSPAATICYDLPITPAIPIRQVKAEDIRSQLKAGGSARVFGVRAKDERFKPSVSKCQVSPALPEAAKPGQEQVTLSDQPAKENNEAKLKDEKNEPSLFEHAIPATVLGAVESGQKQQVDGFAEKASLAVDHTFSEQSAKRNDDVKFEDKKSKQLMSKCHISAVIQGATKPGQEQVHQSGVSAVTTLQAADNTLSKQSAEKNSEAMVGVTKSVTEAMVCTDDSVQSVTDLPVTNVSREAPESKANVCIDETVQSVGAGVPVQNFGANVPVQSVGAGDVPVQSFGANVPMQSVDADDVRVQNIGADVPAQSVGADVYVSSEPSTVDGDIAQALDENREHSSVQMHTVQQSYASLQAMVPEMLKKVTNINGTDVIPMNHALKDERQKDKQPNQKVKLTVVSMVNNSSDQAANGAGPDATNSTAKKQKKKTTQLYVDPAEIIVEFTPGVIMPSREELLSAFGKFGFIIESQTNITKVTRSARVVFGKKAEAENAIRRAEFLGEFGPPFATLKLADLPPIELSAPSPPHSVASSHRPPLPDIRKNLERMILARHSSLRNATSADGLKPVSDKLLADMQGLLAQIDKMLSGPSTRTPP